MLISKVEKKIKEKVEKARECLYKILSDFFEDEFFIRFILKTVWFRGEPKNFATKLQPTIFRYKNSELYDMNLFEFLLIETALMNPFIPKALIPKVGKISIEFYAYLRHLGFPSRLLDFTEDIKVAIYFALDGDGRILSTEEDNSDDIFLIYIFFPRILNLQLSMLHALGQIPSSTEDFSLRARLEFIGLSHKSTWFLNTKWNAKLFLDSFSLMKSLYSKLFKTLYEINTNFTNDINSLLQEISNTFVPQPWQISYSDNILSKIIKLYSTPLSVYFFKSLPIFQNQAATAVFFGGTLHESSIKSLQIFLCNKENWEDLCSNPKNLAINNEFLNNSFFLFPYCFIFPISIKKILEELKQDNVISSNEYHDLNALRNRILQELEELGYHKYKLYGYDPKLILEYVEKQLKKINANEFNS